MTRRASGLVTLGILFATLSAIPAVGRDVDDMAINEGETVEKDYTPVATANPNNSPRGKGNCDVVTYCDTITFTINVPARYTFDDFYEVEVLLSWPNPDLNNLNLYLYDTNGSTQLLAAQTANHPEKLTFLEPPKGAYFLNVLNSSGVNTGYHIKATFRYKGQLAAPPQSDDAGGGSTRFGSSGTRPPATTALPALPPPPATGRTKPRPVESPGADGEMTTKTLSALGPPRVIRRENLVLPFVVVVLLTTGALVAAGFFLWRRRSVELLQEEYSWR